MYTKKDLAELIQLAHKMRMDELKRQADEKKTSTKIGTQINTQINDSPFGDGNYGKLMKELLGLNTEALAS